MDVDMNEADALDALATVLGRIADDPYNLTLHVEHILLARATNMDEQIDSALDMVTAYWATSDAVWLPILERKIAASDLQSADDLQATLDLFVRAEGDYLSIPILQKHIQFLVERYEAFAEQGERPGALGDMFSAAWMSENMSQICSHGVPHLTQSHLLFDLRRDWELERLQNAMGEEKASLVGLVENMLLERLTQPHSNHDETFQAYSSFTTSYKSEDEYESLLVSASKSRAHAVKAYQKRESMETSLAQSGFSLAGYAYYLAFERRAKKPDMLVLKGLYERAIAEADKRRFSGDPAAEPALQSFWTEYVGMLRSEDVDDDEVRATSKRGLRSVPASGELLACYMRFLEASQDDEAATEIAAVYVKSKTVGPLQSDVEQLVTTVIARASYEWRLLQTAEDGVGFESLEEIIMEGISRIRKASPTGDTRVRVEKLFSSICLVLDDPGDRSVQLWKDAVKFYKTSYLAWLAYTDVLAKKNLHSEARTVFKDIAMKNLDWPEAIWDAWVSFEQVNGTVQDLENALERIQKAQTQVNAKRAREAEKVQAEMAAAQLISDTAATVAVDTARSVLIEPTNGPSAMDVDTHIEAGSKRKAEDEGVPEGSKKARVEEPAKLKRDRENSTVFVADLPAGVKDDDLATLFRDCGSIREVKITQLPNSLVATVEFMDRESVPAALTKDKKRVRGREIAVHLAWRSTLYITNFPDGADDTFIRTLFGKYGEIFDVRWPSKKFKNTRRFCYLQFTTPLSAESALELNGTDMDDGHKMSVYVSNPERKKERTDSDANDREIYVAGLSKLATKEDLKNVFKTYSTVKDVRMILDDKGKSKGFAFVEFTSEDDARSALAANNHELKKRRMAVTLADSRVRGKNKAPGYRAEVRNRSVRVRNLPPGTQEGLLQQALEKHARVQRVEVFHNVNEADVELENAAEAGKLLLRPDAIIFNGATLQITAAEGTAGPSASSRPMAPPAANAGLFIPRAAVSRPRAGLGSKQRGLGSTQAARPAAGSSGSGGGTAKGQDDFRKMLSGGK
ncbi:RNA-binding protein Prp24 [Epithele typhae]|uniref:RNA-binding protein Prp24 n=1 Tax=Epithele typhae TaxID=378194 RepID=UPI002008ADE4|nr:RNA-binding protein Prp24 [Epithele typhae]KAH9925424.1 RNA-binding protein Prp24 [Epithele typhae]